MKNYLTGAPLPAPTAASAGETPTKTTKHVAFGTLGGIVLTGVTWFFNNYTLPEKHYPPLTRSAENRDDAKWGHRTAKGFCQDMERAARIVSTTDQADAAKNGRENPDFHLTAAECLALQTPLVAPAIKPATP